MEYSTLAEDSERVQISKTKIRNRILISLIILIIFVLMRGFGMIAIEYNKGYFKGNHEVKKQIYELSNSGNTASQETKNNKITTDDKDSYWNLGFNFKFLSLSSPNGTKDYLENEKNYLERLIKEKISKEQILNENFESALVSVKELNVFGLYWFPLIKNGKSSYQIIFQNSYYQNTYSAEFSGETDFEIYGFCSNDKLEKIIAEKIAKIVVESIKDDYKK